MTLDRRQFARFVPGAPMLVHLGRSTGHLSNLSEGGLAVSRRFPEIRGGIFPLEVELSGGGLPLHTLAQISWTNDSLSQTGVEFVQLPAISRQQLKEWMSTQSSVTANTKQLILPPTTRQNQAPHKVFSPQRASEFGSPESAPKSNVGLSGIIGLVMIVATLWAGFFSVGLYVGSRSEYQWIRSFFHSAVSPAPRVQDQPVSQKASGAEDLAPPVANLANPGFVIQVGAMANENNAQELSATLQENGFPAFVYKHVDDRLYKVAVGSYPDADSAADMKRRLKEKGFDSIVQRWTPE